MKKIVLIIVVLLTVSNNLMAQNQPPSIASDIDLDSVKSYSTIYNINKYKIEKHRRNKWGFLGTAVGLGAMGTVTSLVAFTQSPNPSLNIAYIGTTLNVLAAIFGVVFIYHDYKLDLIQSELNSYGVSLSKKF